jgi:hypothetical protein
MTRMSHPLEELRSLSREELIARHDRIAQHTDVGIKYYLEELARRDSAEQTTEIVKLNRDMAQESKEIRRLTRWVAVLTVAIMVLTAASLLT